MNPFARAPTRAEWRSDRWARLRCLATWNETQDVRSFLLMPEDGARIAFDPGQFLTVRWPGASGTPIERCYTISSSAATERTVTITVKAKSGGALSGRLHRELQPGGTIEAFGPAGRFGPMDAPAERYLLLAVGSGITPMLSILRTAADLGVEVDTTLICGARRQADVIAANDLKSLVKRLPKLRVVTVLSRPPARWRGPRGRIDADLVRRLVPDLPARTVLVCGPEDFMATMRAVCRDAGVPAGHYHEETFDFGAVEIAVPADGPLRRITFAKSGRSFDCPANLTILQGAKLAGIPMPASCGKGQCGTCKCMKLKGAVEMFPNGGIRDREVARGFILPCSAKPETDVTLDR